MKKNLFPLVILMSLAASVVILAACQSGPSSKAGAQMTITITDIPAAYSGMVGMVTLSPPGTQKGKSIAWALENIRSNNSFIGPMLDWDKDKPWYKSGTYFVTFVIDESMDAIAEKGRVLKFTGVILNKSINQDTVSISFEEFVVY